MNFRKLIICFSAGFILCVHLEIKADVSAFQKIGCKMDKGTFLDCSSVGIEERFSCTHLQEPSPELRKLTPSLPILDCYVKGDAPLVRNRKAILYRGCGWLSIFSKYIVLRDTELFELANAEDLRMHFLLWILLMKL
jgi:hypothetical protein